MTWLKLFMGVVVVLLVSGSVFGEDCTGTSSANEVSFVAGVDILADALIATGVAEFAESNLGTAQGEFDTAESNLDTAQGEFDTAESNLDTAESNLDTAQGEFDTAQGEFDTAIDQTFTTTESAQSNLDTAQGILDLAKGVLDTAQGEFDTAESNLGTAESNLGTAQGEFDTAESNLGTAQGISDTAIIAMDAAAEAVIGNTVTFTTSTDLIDRMDAGTFTCLNSVCMDYNNPVLIDLFNTVMDQDLSIVNTILTEVQIKALQTEMGANPDGFFGEDALAQAEIFMEQNSLGAVSPFPGITPTALTTGKVPFNAIKGVVWDITTSTYLLGEQEITGFDGLVPTGEPGLYKLNEKVVYSNDPLTEEFQEPVNAYNNYNAEGEFQSVEFYVCSNNDEGSPGFNVFSGTNGNPLIGTQSEGDGFTTTQYTDTEDGTVILVVDENGVPYTQNEVGGPWTSDNDHYELEGELGAFTGSHSFANFHFNMLQLGTGYMEFGTFIYEKLGGDMISYKGVVWSTWLKTNSPWAVSDDAKRDVKYPWYAWIGSTKEGYTNSICNAWVDGVISTNNGMLGDDSFPAAHIEGDIVNYGWVNESDVTHTENIKVYKITFEVNPKKELTNADYVEFKITVGGKDLDLNGPDNEGGVDVKLETGSASYSALGANMIIRTSDVAGWENYNEETEICLDFETTLKDPYNEELSKNSNKLCNTFAGYDDSDAFDSPDTFWFARQILGVANGDPSESSGSGDESSGSGSSGSGSSGESRPDIV